MNCGTIVTSPGIIIVLSKTMNRKPASFCLIRANRKLTIEAEIPIRNRKGRDDDAVFQIGAHDCYS